MNSESLRMFNYLLRLGMGMAKPEGEEWMACLDDERAGKVDWEAIYRIGVEQGVAAIIFDGLQAVFEGKADAGFRTLSQKMKIKWYSHTVYVEKCCRSQYKTAAEIAGIYAEQGIRTVVLKGIAAGMNYPHPEHRPCGDLDCFLFDDYEKGNLIAESLGASVHRDYFKHSEIIYKGLMIENHQFCTALRGSRKSRNFEKLLQSLLHEEETHRIRETSLECPSPMFNALFLTYHAQGHFLTEGIALRHLCDWAMLIHKYGTEIDWRKFADYCAEYGMKHFADSMTRLAERLIGIDVPKAYLLKADDERDGYLMEEMLYGYSHIFNTEGNRWQKRFMIIRNSFKNSRRYSLFSDTSYIGFILKRVYGFCFDRNPKLD